MFKFLAVLVLCIPAIIADSIKFQDCGSSAKVTDVDVSNCKSEPCPFVHSKNETLKLTFIPDKNSTDPQIKVYGIIAGVSVPFPVSPDACKSKYMPCPVVKGKNTPFGIVIYVSPQYPKLRLLVKLEIMDDDKNDLVCVVFPAVVMDPPSTSG